MQAALRLQGGPRPAPHGDGDPRVRRAEGKEGRGAPRGLAGLPHSSPHNSRSAPGRDTTYGTWRCQFRRKGAREAAAPSWSCDAVSAGLRRCCEVRGRQGATGVGEPHHAVPRLAVRCVVPWPRRTVVRLAGMAGCVARVEVALLEALSPSWVAKRCSACRGACSRSATSSRRSACSIWRTPTSFTSRCGRRGGELAACEVGSSWSPRCSIVRLRRCSLAVLERKAARS